MTDVEFVLSLTPKQIFKFIEFNHKKYFMVGIIKDDNKEYYRLCLYNNVNDENYRMEYKWINNEWKEDAYI